MKVGTESKLKFKRLRMRLNLDLWECRGLLESLWKTCEHNTSDGAIGRLSNEEIAADLEWKRCAPDELVRALVETGWLDEDIEFRLIVHDWSEHAPNYLKGVYSKGDKVFADQAVKSRPTKSRTKRASKATKTTENSDLVDNLVDATNQPTYRTNQPTEPTTPTEEPSGSRQPVADRAEVVREVFAHYRTHHPQAHKKPRSDQREWKLIVGRLGDGYTLDDLKHAIDGCHLSPFHCGENERNRVYQSLELIVRDSSKVAQFMEIYAKCRDGPAPIPKRKLTREERIVESNRKFAERKERDMSHG